MIPLQWGFSWSVEEYQVFKDRALKQNTYWSRLLFHVGNRRHCGVDGEFPKAVHWCRLQEQPSLLFRPRLRSIYYGCQIKTLNELDQQLSSLKQVICLISLEAPDSGQHIYFNLGCGQSCHLITLVLIFPAVFSLSLSSNVCAATK